MSDITNRICSLCRRVVDMNDLSINEGKPFHDHCLLQSTRSRITFLSDKMGRKTATVIDAEELNDLLFIEERLKKDLENQTKIKLSDNDKPVFFGNTPLGKQSAMNSPEWKKILAKTGTLEGTKYHKHKTPTSSPPTIEPVWQITTDENGHKGIIQIGSRPIQVQLEIKNEEISAGQKTISEQSNALIQKDGSVYYEVERIKIDIWRGFVLLDKLLINSNLLDLNARVVALNKERNQLNILAVSA
jgi:hypothetical protein